jgi:hypothetical protein
VKHDEAAGLGRRITLLTDFGGADGYVAAVRGVIASIAPGAAVDDAGHDLAPGDVTAAAWSLARYWQLYPVGTIHLVVVDPGVGSERRSLALEALGRFIVAPDNGCATLVLAEVAAARVHAIENQAFMRHPVSRTFHGRDVFAPVAAHLAIGATLEAIGSPVHDAVRLPLPTPRSTDGLVQGAVVHVDRFGNLVTNLPAERADEFGEIEVEGRTVGPVRATYASVPTGDVLALAGSAGLIEISVRDGDAAALLGVGRGATVRGRLAAG